MLQITMSSNLQAIIILACLWCSVSVVSSNDSRNQTSRKRHETRIFSARNLARGDETLLFAVCMRQDLSAEVRCRVTLKKVQNQDDPNSRISCRIDISPGEGRKFFRPKFDLKLESLGNSSKSVLTFAEVSNSLFDSNVYDKIIILDMHTCTAEHLSFIVFEEYFSEISPRNRLILHENSFDVIASDPKVCENFIRCIVTFDENGKQIDRPRSFPSKIVIQRNKWIESTKGSQGFVVFGNLICGPVGYVAAEYHDISGESRQMELTFEHELSRSRTTSSSANGMFTICSQIKENVFKWNERKGSILHCNQFRPNRPEPILSVTIKNPNNVTALAVHSLANGGFLLLVQECNNKHHSSSLCIFKASNVGVKDGESAVLQLDSQCSGIHDDLTIDVGEAEDRYCFYFLCIHQAEQYSRKMMNFDRKCLSK